MSSTSNFVLELTIKEGTNELPFLCPGLFVHTSLDGSMKMEDNTAIVRMTKNRTVWNHTLSYEFQSLQEVPKAIALSVQRKRSIHNNFQLVGTARFCTTELLSIVDKWEIERKMMIYVPHQTQASGTLTISASIRSAPAHSSSSSCPATTAFHCEGSSVVGTRPSCDGAVVSAQISSVLQLVFTFFIVVSLLIYQIMV